MRGPPWKTNRGHSLLSTLLTPPSKHPWRQFQGPMRMKKNCGQAPPGRETRHKRGTYLTVVHLPHNTSKDRQHTAHSVLKACLCNTRKTLKKHALKGIHYLWYKMATWCGTDQTSRKCRVHVQWVLMIWIDGIIKSHEVLCWKLALCRLFFFLLFFKFSFLFCFCFFFLFASVSLAFPTILPVSQWRSKLSLLHC